MSFLPQPTVQGIYRVKVYEIDKDSYWKYIPDDTRWIQLSTLDESDDQFKWIITPVPNKDNAFTIKLASDPGIALSTSPDNSDKYLGYGLPCGVPGGSAIWRILKNPNGNYSKIYLDGSPYAVDSRDHKYNGVHFYHDEDSDAAKNHFVFELVSPGPEPGLKSVSRAFGGKTFEDLFFQLTPEQAVREAYDIIIIGTGIGGGIIAGDLFDTNSRLGDYAKSVLVIEKGGLPFHSHCLNASRPSGFGEDRGQQNDTFFALFKDDYKFPEPNADWKGGPMYNLGGRSAAWGLFVPRIHDETLKTQFAPGTQLYDSLVHKWYTQAEELMSLSLPTITTTHQNLIERLNIKNKRGCQWEWGRIASEFSESKNFDFATGAYSTIDKLLEIAMSKARRPDGSVVEHPNWKILLGTEARSITWDDDNDEQATGVVIRDANGVERIVKLKSDARGKVLPSSKIVLAAGSVASPAILMRSGKEEFLRKNGGLHLTDHDIFAKAYTCHYMKAGIREKVGAMKLQTYVRLKSQSIALCNMAIDASSFLPREFLPNKYYRNESFPKYIAAFIRPCPLNEANTITLDENQEPIVTINRSPPFDNSHPDVQELRDLTLEAVEVIKEALCIEVRGLENDDIDNYFKPLELGGVAHELGTIPMQGGVRGKPYCVDSDLRLRNHKGVYVCDLSVFPYSPEVNPTLTLAALALRLSRTEILPPLPLVSKAIDTVYVVNQTGENVQVFVSNRGGIAMSSPEEVEILTPGQLISRRRVPGIAESVFVYRLDYNSQDKYLAEPVLHVAHPGSILAL